MKPEPSAALARLRSYLAMDPANPSLLAEALDLSLAEGDLEGARQHASAAQQHHPQDPFLQWRQAQVEMAGQQWAAAAARLQPLLAQQAQAALAAALAACYLQLGQAERAWDVLAPFSSGAQLDGAELATAVRCLHHLDRLAEASALIAAQRERVGSAPAFLAAASLALFDHGEVDAALAAADAALAGPERPIEALVVRATAAVGLDQPEQAGALFEEVLAKRPREGRSWSGLGMASMLRHQLGPASAQLEQAVACMPGHIGSWHLLAWCRMLERDLDAAAAALDRALALDRNFGETHGALAVLAALAGRRSEAEEAIARAERLDREGLSARYARMLLDGATAEPASFQRLAMAVLSRHRSLGGESVADLVRRHAR